MGFFEIFSAALAGFYGLIPSLGLAIILLTIAVRVLLLPLSLKQTRSMREMQRIQPEVKKLQQKHKGDRQKMNEAMMALYKEHGVNPFGGCAPLLMQFPVLIGLFYVVRTPLAYMGYEAVREGDKIAGWAVDNASRVPEAIQSSALAHGLDGMAQQVNQFLGIRLDCNASAAISSQPPGGVVAEICGTGFVSALPYLVMVLLMGLTTWYQQKQMQAKQDSSSPQAQQMQMLGRIMPIMLMFFAFSFPSGVVLYWLTTNVWTIAQQRVMLRVAPAPGAGTPARAAGGGSKAPSSKPETGAPPKGAPAKPAAEAEEGAPKPRPHPSSKKKKRRR